MNREELVLERLRAADPAPDLARIDPNELSTILLLLEERRGAMTTRTPIRPPPEGVAQRRGWRPAIVFSVSMILVLIAVGVGFVISGGSGEEAITPSETTTPTQTTIPATTTPTTRLKADQEPTATTVLPEPLVVLPELSWLRADIERVVDPNGISGIASGPDGFLMGSEGILLTSPDGATWTAQDQDPEGVTEYVGYENGLYVALASSQDAVGNLLDSVSWTSVDGMTWERGTALDIDVWGLGAGAPGFVAVGMDEEPPIAAISFSPDGKTWTRVPNDDDVFSGASEWSWTIARDVAYGPDGYVIVGEDDFTSGDVKAAVWFSPDGLSWQRVPHENTVFGVPDTPTWFSMFAVTHGDAGYVAVGVIDGPDRHSGAFWYSPDGITWELSENDVSGGETVEDVVAINGGYLAAGDVFISSGDDGTVQSQAAIWFSPDGRTWARLPDDEAFSPDGNQSMLHQIATDGETIVAYGYRERLAENPPPDDPEATHEWVDTIWYSPIG